MELFLNLAWMLLALPAYLLWRRNTAAQPVRGLSSLQCLLALGCVLVLLFPVISASDDLHAMRAEMEESATSKRTVRQAAGEKSSTWTNRLQNPPAIAESAARFTPSEVGQLQVLLVRVSPLMRPAVFTAGRAPPCSLLG